jgi:hypothetical protein
MMSLSPLAEREPPFSVSPATTTELEQSLEGAVRKQEAAMERLHAAVDACVAELHRLGMTPEAALITMKALVRHTAVVHPPPGYAPSRWAAESYLEQIGRWSITAYFRLECPTDDARAGTDRLPEASPGPRRSLE